MNGLYQALAPLHIGANLIWIGSILSVGAVLGAGDTDARTRGRLARSLYLKLSTPAFGAALALGVILLLLSPGYYFVETKFMHAKLTLAIVVIVLHHVVGARAKKMAEGRVETAGPIGFLEGVLLAAAFTIVFLAVLKPF